MVTEFVIIGVFLVFYALVLVIFKGNIKSWGEMGRNMILVIPPLILSQSIRDVIIKTLEIDSFWLSGILLLTIALPLTLVNSLVLRKVTNTD